jgi:hypothetical protein
MQFQVTNSDGIFFNLSTNPGIYTKVEYKNDFKNIYYRLDNEKAFGLVERICRFVTLVFKTVISLSGSHQPHLSSQWREVLSNKREVTIASKNLNLLPFAFPDRANNIELVKHMEAKSEECFNKSKKLTMDSDLKEKSPEAESKDEIQPGENNGTSAEHKSVSYSLTPNPDDIEGERSSELFNQAITELLRSAIAYPLEKFIGNLRDMHSKKENYESANCYNQFYVNLMKLYSEDLFPNKWNIVAVAINELLNSNNDLPKEMVYYAIYRLWNEHSVAKMQQFISLKDKWEVLKVPGDGNCMLWSCLLSHHFEECTDPSAAYKRFSNFKELETEHPDYAAMHEAMMSLRKKIAATFRDLIDKDLYDFGRHFVYYALSNPEVRNAVIDKENEEELSLSGVPSKEMIQKYCDYIKTPRQWNGEFEAQIIARIMERPIVILRGNSDKKMIMGVVAGCEFLGNSDKNPLIIRHSGAHYDCLL